MHCGVRVDLLAPAGRHVTHTLHARYTHGTRTVHARYTHLSDTFHTCVVRCQLDITVVTLAWLPILFPSFGSYSFIRSVRALRPLRALKRVPGMPLLIKAIMAAIPKLVHVAALCVFLFLVFGIVGVELYQGTMHYRCALPGARPAKPRACNHTSQRFAEARPSARAHARVQHVRAHTRLHTDRPPVASPHIATCIPRWRPQPLPRTCAGYTPTPGHPSPIGGHTTFKRRVLSEAAHSNAAMAARPNAAMGTFGPNASALPALGHEAALWPSLFVPRRPTSHRALKGGGDKRPIGFGGSAQEAYDSGIFCNPNADTCDERSDGEAPTCEYFDDNPEEGVMSFDSVCYVGDGYTVSCGGRRHARWHCTRSPRGAQQHAVYYRACTMHTPHRS